MSKFISCLPALLTQFDFAPDGNPGEIPADTLAVLGALAIREAQLDNAQLVTEKLAEGLQMIVEDGTLVFGAQRIEIELLRQQLTSQASRGAAARSDMWAALDNLRDEKHAHETTKAALAEAQSKLACIEAVTSGKGVGTKSEPESGAPAQVH